MSRTQFHRTGLRSGRSVCLAAVLPLLIAGTLSSCVVSLGGRSATTTDAAATPGAAQVAATDASAKADDAKPGKGKAKAKKARDRERALHLAELGLKVAELEARQSRTKAEHSLADAQRELEEQRRELALFVDHELPHKLAEAQLGIDRAEHRRELAEDELNELISMYAAEEFAELTKELVLKRGRKSLEFSERALELEREERQVLEQETLPKRRRELEHEVAVAERAVARAQVAHQKTQLEVDVALTKARNELEDLREPDDGADGADGAGE